MQGRKSSVSLTFLFTVILLILRPFIIFSSPAIQQAYSKESRVFGLVRSVKKRKESFSPVDLFREEEKKVVAISFLAFLLLFFKRWLRKAIELLSIYISGLHHLLKRRRTFFEVYPDNQHYLALSVFRI
jgi:hypothetical protein